MDIPSELTFDNCLIFWRWTLSALLGWDEARVMRWALQFKHHWDLDPSPAQHFGPMKYVASLLVLPEYCNKLDVEACYTLNNELEQRLMRAFRGVNEFDEIDWPNLREQINGKLRAFGYSLDDVAKR